MLERAAKFSRRFERQLWYVFGMWVLLSAAFFLISLQITYAWYLVDTLGVVGGAWLGYKYYYWVTGFYGTAVLLLAAIGSLVLAILIVGMMLLPYAAATSPANQFFGIQYPAADVGFASSVAAFGAPFVIFVSLSVLHASYKASRTVSVHHERYANAHGEQSEGAHSLSQSPE
jgi:hypothetical protein